MYSNDTSQKSEYKQFKPFHLKRKQSKKPTDTRTSQFVKTTNELLTSKSPNNVLHINQVEFGGEPAKADIKFGSKITVGKIPELPGQKTNKSDKL